MFLQEILNITSVTLNKAWISYYSTLTLYFKPTEDCLWELRAKRKFFSFPNKIFLDEDINKSQAQTH